MSKSDQIIIYHRIDPLALFSILLAGIALGVIAHEIMHVLLISNPSTISLHLGDPEVLFSVCCLSEGENAFEHLALFLQFAVMVVWVFLNKNVWLYEVHQKIFFPTPKSEKIFAKRLKKLKY
ncbi:MAG: hypothetical protein V1847_03135 [Candidatus Diapherotrites archaeon]